MTVPTMRLTNIAFNDDQDPTEVTVVMSVSVAAVLAKWAGGQRETDPHYEQSHAVYECLTGALFNRFYENGVDDYLAEMGR